MSFACACCGKPMIESAGWARCHDCDRVYCPTCPAEERAASMKFGECGSTTTCACGATSLVAAG